MDRLSSGMATGWTGNEYYLQNCTWHGGQFYLQRSGTACNAGIHDTIFDGTTIGTSDSYAGNPTYTDYGYNAFITGADYTDPTSTNDVLVSSFDWQTSSLGNYYIPTNSALIDAGSQNATNFGLYHFTSCTNQVKETNSTVNIGYHYVAVDGSGNALDYDSDGLADYFEDKNGDGIANNGESDWKLADTDGDGVSDFLEWQQGRNPNGSSTTTSGNGAINLRVYTPLK
jgi:hypothetical protein